MAEIGIITYHNAVNYGAVLQSYSLEKYVQKYTTVEIINYICPAIERQYSFRGIRYSFSLLNFLSHNITCFFHHRKKKRFKAFVISNMVLSNALERNDLLNTHYKKVITGSDQVFNPFCNGCDPSYFLDFCKDSKRYSYAASLGSIEQFNSSSLNTESLLNTFECISLREQDAVDYLKPILASPIIQSIDPVWLLNKEEWLEICKRKKRKPYILVYNLMDYKKMNSYVKDFARKRNLPVITINRTIMGDLMYLGSSRLMSNCSPSEFLGLIADCEYFFTDSFHGTSFAMIFEKQFGVFVNEHKYNTNSRIENILDLTDLNCRIANNCGFDVDQRIEYGSVQEKMQRIITDSQKYLQRIIKDN